jgi:hypothetical protein
LLAVVIVTSIVSNIHCSAALAPSSDASLKV